MNCSRCNALLTTADPKHAQNQCRTCALRSPSPTHSRHPVAASELLSNLVDRKSINPEDKTAFLAFIDTTELQTLQVLSNSVLSSLVQACVGITVVAKAHIETAIKDSHPNRALKRRYSDIESENQQMAKENQQMAKKIQQLTEALEVETDNLLCEIVTESLSLQNSKRRKLDMTQETQKGKVWMTSLPDFTNKQSPLPCLHPQYKHKVEHKKYHCKTYTNWDPHSPY